MSDFSIATYTANGAANVQYAVPFGFISRSHVLVLTAYDKSLGTYTQQLQPGTGFTWISDTTIQIPSLAAGTVFSIVRQTPKNSPLVNWVAGGGALTAEELELSSLQNLYSIQEQQDRNDASVIATADATAAAAASALAAAEEAQEASADAQAAVASAGTAVSTANTALSTANAATNTANSATTTALNALSVANNVASLSRSSSEGAAIVLNAAFSIGRPGSTPFGVGPVPTSGATFSGLGQGDYNPVHHASGSFC
jgi:hypothetical protein